MSVAEQIGRLAQNLVASRNMVTQKNGTVGSAVAFDNLAGEIMSITASQGEQVLVDDTDTAYRKSILNGAQKYAKLKSIGGMTYKSNNLIPFPYNGTRGEGYTITNNGITFVVNGDGSVTCNGTATGKAVFDLLTVSPLPTDAVYDAVTMSGCPIGGSATTYYLYNLQTGHKEYGTPIIISAYKGSYCRYAICVESGTTLTNIVFKPMVNFGRTALPFEKHYEGLRDTKVTAIRSHGANLIPYPYLDTTKTHMGITYTDNDDGTITANGTASGFASFVLSRSLTLIHGQTYGIKDVSSGLDMVITYKDANGNTKYAGREIRWDSSYTFVSLYIQIANTTVNNIVIKPMMVLGTVFPTEYKPYREPITYTIPEALQGSGKGVAGYNDTVDFENGKYIKRVSTAILTGTEYTIYKPLPDTRPWLYYIGANTLNNPAVNKGLICNAFNASTSGWAEQTIGDIMITNHYLIFTWYPEKTADDFRAFLAERYANGNPVIVTYPINPIETDLAETIGNIIEIEEGGFLEFVNKHGNAMPSHISYLRRL